MPSTRQRDRDAWARTLRAARRGDPGALEQLTPEAAAFSNVDPSDPVFRSPETREAVTARWRALRGTPARRRVSSQVGVDELPQLFDAIAAHFVVSLAEWRAAREMRANLSLR